jgi:hypothetical protein
VTGGANNGHKSDVEVAGVAVRHETSDNVHVAGFRAGYVKSLGSGGAGCCMVGRALGGVGESGGQGPRRRLWCGSSARRRLGPRGG